MLFLRKLLSLRNENIYEEHLDDTIFLPCVMLIILIKKPQIEKKKLYPVSGIKCIIFRREKFFIIHAYVFSMQRSILLSG